MFILYYTLMRQKWIVFLFLHRCALRFGPVCKFFSFRRRQATQGVFVSLFNLLFNMKQCVNWTRFVAQGVPRRTPHYNDTLNPVFYSYCIVYISRCSSISAYQSIEYNRLLYHIPSCFAHTVCVRLQ